MQPPCQTQAPQQVGLGPRQPERRHHTHMSGFEPLSGAPLAHDQRGKPLNAASVSPRCGACCFKCWAVQVLALRAMDTCDGGHGAALQCEAG